MASQNIKFVEKTEYEKGFGKFFEEKILPKLHELEDYRIKRKSIGDWSLRIGLFLALVLSINTTAHLGLFHLLYFSFAFLVSATLIFILPYIYFQANLRKKFAALVYLFFADFKYQYKGNIDIEDIQASHLFGAFDKLRGKHYLSGEYESVPFRLQEIRITKGPSFEGIYFEAEFPKSFHGETYVLRDQGKFLNSTHYLTDKDGKKLERVMLEDPRFESTFEVYSNDQVEARYLLTTSLMERLVELTDVNFGGYTKTENPDEIRVFTPIRVAFRANKIIISIQTSRRLFSMIHLNTSVYDLNHFHAYLAQMNALFQIIHTLKLNQRIGL